MLICTRKSALLFIFRTSKSAKIFLVEGNQFMILELVKENSAI
jgi:hypothetical protein